MLPALRHLQTKSRATIIGRTLTALPNNRSKIPNPSHKISSIQYHCACSSGFHCVEHPIPLSRRQSRQRRSPQNRHRAPRNDNDHKVQKRIIQNHIMNNLPSPIRRMHNLALHHHELRGPSLQQSSLNSKTSMSNDSPLPKWTIGGSHHGPVWMKRNGQNIRTGHCR